MVGWLSQHLLWLSQVLRWYTIIFNHFQNQSRYSISNTLTHFRGIGFWLASQIIEFVIIEVLKFSAFSLLNELRTLGRECCIIFPYEVTAAARFFIVLCSSEIFAILRHIIELYDLFIFSQAVVMEATKVYSRCLRPVRSATLYWWEFCNCTSGMLKKERSIKVRRLIQVESLQNGTGNGLRPSKSYFYILIHCASISCLFSVYKSFFMEKDMDLSKVKYMIETGVIT